MLLDCEDGILGKVKMIDCGKILLARNRVKEPHKVYLYEAQINILSGFAGGTVSENVHAIVAAFLKRIGKKMPYLKKSDHIQINNIRRAITALR